MVSSCARCKRVECIFIVSYRSIRSVFFVFCFFIFLLLKQYFSLWKVNRYRNKLIAWCGIKYKWIYWSASCDIHLQKSDNLIDNITFLYVWKHMLNVTNHKTELINRPKHRQVTNSCTELCYLRSDYGIHYCCHL